MSALIGLVGNLSGGAVVVRRLGRHIGLRPFKSEREGVQLEASQISRKYPVIVISNWRIDQKKIQSASVGKKKVTIRKQNSPVEDKRAVSASLGEIWAKHFFFLGATILVRLVSFSGSFTNELEKFSENGRLS